MGAPVDSDSSSNRILFERLLALAKQYRRQFALVILFSFLYTGLDLIQPLIYRRAINDVAGLFVAQNGDPPAEIPERGEPHRKDHVAPRTAEQTLRTLLESVVLLYLLSVASYYFYLRADFFGARAASNIEARMIVDTFGHVLRLPLSFFSRQASAGLAKRIDQSDQVAPVVHAFSQEIAPEIIRLFGICAIMLTQNWEMAIVSVCLLPAYMWIARRSALRLRSNMDPYYQLWENISARIADAMAR